MHRLSLLYGLLLTGSTLPASLSFAAPELPTPSMLANTCAGCHGTNGSSVGPASPSIAGISKKYFIETMQAFKNEQRPATIMTRIAKGYSDEEIHLMADYFSKQKMLRYVQAFDADKARAGKSLHNKYCDKCHEDSGRSAEDDAGILAGQWAPYLRYTMDDFTQGTRSIDKKMQKKLDELNKAQGDQGVEALIHFYSSQQ
jgi:sulfide dehydrogenase cytochrome subunit